MRKPQPKIIGPAVRNYRTMLGMTQSQVAELADVAPETLSRIERNKLAASLDLTRRLAAALDVKVDDLFVSAERPRPRSLPRPAERRLLAMVRQLDEPQIDDIVRALRTLLAVGASATSSAARARRARLAQG
jgi:DNA-binding XRE family transcriptional regulator